jgi:hypothetical protein
MCCKALQRGISLGVPKHEIGVTIAKFLAFLTHALVLKVTTLFPHPFAPFKPEKRGGLQDSPYFWMKFWTTLYL